MTMQPAEVARTAQRRIVLRPCLWVGAAVAYTVLLVTAGTGGGRGAHAVQVLGPLMLVLALRDMATARAREVWTGDARWECWLVTLALLVPATIGAVVLLFATL